MRMLGLAAGLWSASWLLVLASGFWLSGWPAASVIAVGMLIYALGECIYTAIVTPTAASIAPDVLRGRYLAVMDFAWQAGFMVGPAGGGFLIGRSPLAFPTIAAAICVALAILLPRLRLVTQP
jgi:MFS family permease